jgi:hypothetical protein
MRVIHVQPKPTKRNTQSIARRLQTIEYGPRRATSQESKKVSFNLNKNELYASEQQHYSDPPQAIDTWYSAQDFKEFRRRAVMAVKALKKSDKAKEVCYENIITQTYAACCQAFKETDRVLSSYKTELLKHCMDAKLLGLDKYAGKAVHKHRSKRRTVIRKAVMFVHEDTDGNCGIIRAKSESISLTSRLYARLLGGALDNEIMGKGERYITTTATPLDASFQRAEALAA